MKRLLTFCLAICLIFTATNVRADVITNVVRIAGATPGQPEIATWPDGLQEGAQAYLDRWGKWGKDNEGYYHWDKIPYELIGADYVKTYNKDKKAKDVIYSVTVGQKAKLYIFIDGRYVKEHGNPPFFWLTDGSSGTVFSDAGQKIILHEIKTLPKPSSKTRLFYIYAAEVPAGYYKLKATYDGSGSRSFYGIAAVKSVDIDIKPGSYPNAINLDSQGVIPVAILSSSFFDATTVDPDTVALGGTSVAVRGKGNKYLAHEEDINGDGLIDLLVQVETENLDPNSFQNGYAVLLGQTYDGVQIEGSDEIVIVPD